MMGDFGNAIAGSMGALVVVYLALPLFPLLYVIIRWRAGGQGEPGLGLHAGLLYLRSLALLIAVTGLSLILHSVVGERSDSHSMEEMRRIAGGLLMGGILLFGLQFLIIGNAGLSTRTSPATRVFHGFVMLVSGLASAAAILVLCILIFQEDTEFKDMREIIAWAVVWTGMYIIHVRLLSSGVE